MQRKRLSSEIALKLGLELKKKPSKGGNALYMLDELQIKKLNELKKEDKLIITGKSTLKDNNGNLIMEWVKTSTEKENQLKAFKIAINELKKDIKPFKKTKQKETYTNKNLCNQYILTDFHLGMMAWGEETGADWDTKIAEKVLIDYFSHAIKLSPNADKAVFAQLGDFLHWDGLDAVTPASKHILDADVRFSKLIRISLRVIRKIINMLLEKYSTVDVFLCEGNHDLASSAWLREVFSMFYEKEHRINIDTRVDPYYCHIFGDNCLFYHHGHKRNIKNIDSVFVSKFKEEYGESKHVFAHTGHLHSDSLKETNLMIIEQHRTLSAKDAYASRGGWSSGRDSKVITYHKKYGEVQRNTISIDVLK